VHYSSPEGSCAEILRTSDFDYELPPELIAQVPLATRDASRLLVLNRGTGAVSHRQFVDLPDLVAAGDLVVVNDSRVIPARLLARRSGGGAAEVLLIARETDGTWRALVRPGARIRAGSRLRLPGDDAIEIVAMLPSGQRRVRLAGDGGDEAIIARHGQVPLPPYITREPQDLDRERYQTVYAAAPGSVAAPTAGLHFTPGLLARLEERGAAVARLTLHVGPGTFRPVAAADPDHHVLDAEWFTLPSATARRIAETRERGRDVWAVGTTVARTLEACGEPAGTVRAEAGRTALFIRPGHSFRVVDHLLTNFHLPRSTLLMLVAAFAGREQVLQAYAEAIRHRYRFYSYGDAMLVL
jgi:S-adenosylmethionine:tRNA ribosyltransferase-isomerase